MTACACACASAEPATRLDFDAVVARGDEGRQVERERACDLIRGRQVERARATAVDEDLAEPPGTLPPALTRLASVSWTLMVVCVEYQTP